MYFQICFYHFIEWSSNHLNSLQHLKKVAYNFVKFCFSRILRLWRNIWGPGHENETHNVIVNMLSDDLSLDK